MMMKIRLCVMAAALLASAVTASASGWFTQTDEDVFSGKQTAVMFGGEPNSGRATLYFTCSADHNVSVAYIFPLSIEMLSGLKGTLVIKIDGGDTLRFATESYDHNDKYGGFKAELDETEAFSILTPLASARKKVLIGLSADDFGVKESFSVSARGSTAATTKFIKACDLKDSTEGGKWPKLPGF